MKIRPTILLVEDNRDDQKFVQLALEFLEIDAQLDVVDNAKQAFTYLMREAPYEDKRLPDLVLLDINMPRVSGIEVLDLIKADPKIAMLPFIVLTTSDAQEDIDTCYAKGCNAYVTKPFGHKELLDKLKKLCGFWLDAAHLPVPRSATAA
ncbi:MAG: response regulator [Planctomycetota bacterium]